MYQTSCLSAIIPADIKVLQLIRQDLEGIFCLAMWGIINFCKIFEIFAITALLIRLKALILTNYNFCGFRRTYPNRLFNKKNNTYHIKSYFYQSRDTKTLKKVEKKIYLCCYRQQFKQRTLWSNKTITWSF